MSAEAMADLAHKRAEKWPDIRPLDAPYTRLVTEKPAFVGVYSYTSTGGGTRWLDFAKVLRPFGVPQTETELTRDYLRAAYKLPVKLMGAQIARAPIWQSPLYADAGWRGDGVYVDLRSAYWQIVRAVGFNVEYRPNGYIGIGRLPEDAPVWLTQSKTFRASMVSMARPSLSATVYHPLKRELQQWRMMNLFSQPLLVALVMDVLHGVAADMVKYAQAAYVNTDGYIVDAAHEDTALSILSEWGLVGRVKGRGETIVHGTASYDIGQRKAKSIVTTAATTHLRSENPWLRQSWGRVANRAAYRLDGLDL